MSLLSTIEGVLDDQADDWVADLVDRADGLAREHLPADEVNSVSVGLAILDDHAADLAHLGAGGLISVLTRAGFGKLDDAKLTYLATGATFEERRAASHASTAGTVAATSEREQAWKAVESMLEGLGQVVLKLLPVLIMAA